LDAAVGRDPTCRKDLGCPNPTYLRAHGVLLTDSRTVTLPFVANLAGVAGQDQPSVHSATIILVDRNERRIGEFAYTVDFRIRSANV
jgi:hypothetical protein